ncbi:hypothetical protein CK203_084084 [Vitis vinifera]|uniref:Secreted protein n=1 Tax=Vitis vinifera TaxID=29760 RepID=A0A438FK03_VITVI|nr:hypothetical protein CK203_084084 [Vitis vinifera]
MARLVINRVAWDSNSWPFLAIMLLALHDLVHLEMVSQPKSVQVSRVTVHKKQSWKRCAAHMFT